MGHFIRRHPTACESDTRLLPRTLARNPMLRSQLVELGEKALSAVAAGVAAGAPIAKCQLLASEFYEALQRELRDPSTTDAPHRASLTVAASQCERIAAPSIGSSVMLDELANALAALQSSVGTAPQQRPRPVLRVIEGGLSND